MAAEVRVVEGPDRGRTFKIEPGRPLTIGRGQNSDTKLVDPSISRIHCQVDLEGGVLMLLDNGSASGTVVNGRKVDRHPLADRDRIQIGNSQLEYRQEGVHEQKTMLAAGDKAPRLSEQSADRIAGLVGQRLSYYELVEELRRGQSGVVFRGVDTRDGKPVAIKVLAPEYARVEDEVQRFIRAMKTAIELRHPNIVSLYGAGKNGETLWLAMEYVDGESLARVIEGTGTLGMLDWRFAMGVGLQIARALDAADQKQIVHRNIKPENILIRTSDKVAKLGDLMLAKGLSEMSAQQITRPGQMVGDLVYSSPERTESEALVDTRSDIYGLGVTLYELLTGRHPFEGTSLIETIKKIRTETPPPPKKFQLSVPDLFEGTVMRMIAKRPEDRHQTPAELLRDLERVAKYNGLAP